MTTPQIGTTQTGPHKLNLQKYFQQFNSIELVITGAGDEARLAALTEAVPTGGSISVVAPESALFSSDHDPLDRFYALIAPLEDRLGAVLHTVPSDFEYSPTKLAVRLDRLPDGYRHALQFCNNEWYKERLRSLLEERDLAFCHHDTPGHVAPEWITGPFLYARQHGRGYTSDEIFAMASRLEQHLDRNRPIYCYFVNQMQTQASDAAAQLASRLDRP